MEPRRGYRVTRKMLLAATLLSTATAAPRFVGEAEDVRIAERAWQAATACAGRPGRAAPEVELVRKTNPLDYLGVAHTDEGGTLWRIDLNADADRQREVVVHEVTHAWVSEGPVALVEGSAELLADCVVRADPGLAPLQFDDGRDLVGLPDLTSWRKPGEDAPTELHAFRTDAYVGAARLLRTLADVVGTEVLWDGHALGWEDVRQRLLASGERGAELLAALDGGADSQRWALADEDRDGLTSLQERWLGTDDRTFDSDRDGWWDGAAAPAGAVVLPLDGTPVCAPGGVVRVGSEARGAALPDVLVEGPVARLSGLPSTDSTGGWWVVPADRSGDGPCESSARVTVWTDDPALASLVPEVSAAVEQALSSAEARLGAGPQRVAVVLGGTSRVEGEVVRLGAQELADPARAGRVAVAARRLWLDGVRDWTAVDAVARALARS